MTKKSVAMYGISRIDDEIYRTHAWRVSLRRHGKSLVRNFADIKCGGKRKALQQAKTHRNELLEKYPPISRKEFASIMRRNNNSGVLSKLSLRRRLTRSPYDRLPCFWSVKQNP